MVKKGRIMSIVNMGKKYNQKNKERKLLKREVG
jgi:hypothetical protein